MREIDKEVLIKKLAVFVFASSHYKKVLFYKYFAVTLDSVASTIYLVYIYIVCIYVIK